LEVVEWKASVVATEQVTAAGSTVVNGVDGVGEQAQRSKQTVVASMGQ
jgi:PII-like signaling protein